MFDEGKSIECGKEMNEVERTGQNEEHKLKLILITYCNYYIFKNISIYS